MKKYAINIDETNRVLRATFSEFADADSILVDSLPEGDLYEYLYENGEFIHSPRELTQEELDEIARQEAEAQKAEEREEFLSSAPARVDGLEGQMQALTSAFGGME